MKVIVLIEKFEDEILGVRAFETGPCGMKSSKRVAREIRKETGGDSEVTTRTVEVEE